MKRALTGSGKNAALNAASRSRNIRTTAATTSPARLSEEEAAILAKRLAHKHAPLIFGFHLDSANAQRIYDAMQNAVMEALNATRIVIHG